MPLVFFTFSRVLRRAWRLRLTDTLPPRPPPPLPRAARFSHSERFAGRRFARCATRAVKLSALACCAARLSRHQGALECVFECACVRRPDRGSSG
eukprot:271191-Prorocentrum_minimum.AAC.1